MKRENFFLSLVTIMLAFGFTACSDDDEKGSGSETLSGFYIVNQGNQSAAIPASITAVDLVGGTATDANLDAFANANNIGLGDGAQQAIVYDGKLYIAMYGSNLIWVCDAETLKVLKTIRPEGDAVNPRAFAAKDGKIYCSMFTGYVCRIDAKTLEIDKTIKVGPNPEQLAIAGNKLIVANSDGYNSKANYEDCSISIIDLATLNETKIKDTTKVLNPTAVVSNGTEVFVVCMGNYGDIAPSVKKVDYNKNEVTGNIPGSFIAIKGDKLYVIDAPFTSAVSDYTYKTYDVVTLRENGVIADRTTPADAEIEYPGGIGVDPVSGDIVILSYKMGSNGYAQYRLPGYANVYGNDGKFKKRFECGVGPVNIAFVHK